MPNPLAEKIIDFFKDNPDEALTVDDMEVKFTGKGVSAFDIEDVVEALVKDKVLVQHDGLYGIKRTAVKPPKKKIVIDKETKEALDKLLGRTKKKRNPAVWRSGEFKPAVKYTAPYWIRENTREPWTRYNAPEEESVDVVRRFWVKVSGKESCELWANCSTGEKEIVPLYDYPRDGWVPLVRSERGEVSFATIRYDFLKRKG